MVIPIFLISCHFFCSIASKLTGIFEFVHFSQLIAIVGGMGAVCFLITNVGISLYDYYVA